MDANETTDIDATFSVGATAGSLILTATGSYTDQGSYFVTVVQPAVQVTPIGGSSGQDLPQFAGYFTQRFEVRNIGTVTDSYTYSCPVAGPVTCVSLDKPSATLVPNAVDTVNAAFTTEAPGAAQLSLRASGAAVGTGTLSFNVVVPSPRAASINTGLTSPGSSISRNLCTTVAIGPSAASECGDLSITHPLPALVTMNKARAPMLVYNSATAAPRPIVRADITLPPASSLPLRIDAKLWNCATAGGGGCSVIGTGSWAGTQWSPGMTRRIAVSFDGLALPTGFYDQTLEILAVYASTSLSSTIPVSSVLVNRSGSPFGAGWWLVGLEQIIPVSGGLVWVGGDGSIKQYRPVPGQAAWVADALVAPDTILATAWGGYHYVRSVPGGARVYFDASGYHRSTLNRQGHQTTFNYNPDFSLESVALPAPVGPRYYRFSYTGTPARLSSITLPGVPVRIVNVFDSAGTIASITDPANGLTRFTVMPGQPQLIVGRTDGKGAQTTFAYANGSRIVQSGSINMGPGVPGVTVWTQPAQLLGLTPGPSFDPAQFVTTIDGPRTDTVDVTKMWLDRLGQPILVRDPYNRDTRIVRGDSRWPGLATRVQYSNGRVVSAAYDSQGNLTSTTDSSSWSGGRYATTRFEWDSKWRTMTKVVPPEGDSTVRAVDAATGNLLWTQDARGSASRTTFSYNGSNQVVSSDGPLSPPDSVAYDSLGNMAATRTPLGFRSAYLRNSRGLIVLDSTPIDSAQTLFQTKQTSYDAGDRDTLTVVTGPATSYYLGTGVTGSSAQRQMSVRKYFDSIGQLDSVARYQSPDPTGAGRIVTRWRRDRAGRVVAEVAADLAVDSTEYDAAGNPISTISRRGAKVVFTYDALNRMKSKIMPAVHYAQRTTNYFFTTAGARRLYPFPMFANDGAGYVVSGDTTAFGYDDDGNMVRADNRDARIRRTYYTNGLLWRDSLYTRTWAELSAGGNFTAHAYGLEHTYDLNGRPKTLLHPSQLAPRTAQNQVQATVSQFYTGSGMLDRVVDNLGQTYRYVYDLNGQVDSLLLPGGMKENRDYDVDGRMVYHELKNKSGLTGSSAFADSMLRASYYRFDAGGRALTLRDRSSTGDTASMAYNGMGQLVRQVYSFNSPPSVDYSSAHRYAADSRFYPDPFSNRGSSAVTRMANSFALDLDTAFATFQPGTGRILSKTRNDNQYCCGTSLFNQSYQYDAAGNVVFVQNGPATEAASAYYYDAENRLSASDDREGASHGVFQQNRYDALGRRILVRMRQDKFQNEPFDYFDTHWLIGTIRRTVWDGDQEVYEIQSLGADSATPAQLENDTTRIQHADVYYLDTSFFYGRLAYISGIELDRPLAVIRMAYGEVKNRPIPNGGTASYASFPTFTLVPHWDARGFADHGSYGDGRKDLCITGPSACVRREWRSGWEHPEPLPHFGYPSYHGTLMSDRADAGGLVYRRSRYYDPGSGRFTQEDPTGLAGGLNAYGFAEGDPVNKSDPFGLCPSCATAALGAFVFGSIQVVANMANGRPAGENLVRSLIYGAVAGGTFGLAAPEATAAFTVRIGAAVLTSAPAVASAVVSSSGGLGGTAGRIVDALKSAGPQIAARTEAVYAMFPKSSGLDVLSRVGENGETIISGGIGNRLTQVILNQDGSSIVQKFDAVTNTWNTVATILFKQ